MRPGGPVARAVRGGLGRRRVQTVVIGLVVLVSAGASVLALALLVDSSSPFDHVFAAQRGADVVASIDPALATRAELAATTRLPEVTAAAGPFAQVRISATAARPSGALPPMTLAGRPDPGGPVDDLTLRYGHWARRPGQIVLAASPSSNVSLEFPLGTRITVTSVRGKPTLTVVGVATSASDSADGWVAPAEIAWLRPTGTPPSAQLLYRFASAGSAAAIRADIAAVSATLPAGAVTVTQSYLPVKLQETSTTAPFVPFLVAFGVIGIVMSVLIVANVVTGAVVAGYRRIGILKSIGFTPGQVVAAYTGQVTLPAGLGCLGGVVLGNLLALVLLQQEARVYGAGTLGVPGWVDVIVPAAMCGLVAIAALLPAARAGRLSAVQAIAAGRAPGAGRGYAAYRLLGRLRLPRPVTIGLAAPFARPARTAVTLTAILLGATAVTFAVGLSGSLDKVVTGLSRATAQPVQIVLSSQTDYLFDAGDQRAVDAALAAQPGTLHYTAETDQEVSVAGLAGQHPVTVFRGHPSWTGYPVISGHWYTGPGQVDVSTGFLTATGKAVGDTVTITLGGRQIPARIVGELFDDQGRGNIGMVTSYQTLARAGTSLTRPDQYDVGLRPGTSAAAYSRSLGGKLGSRYQVSVNSSQSVVVTLMIGLIGTLTLLLAIVAGLGVLNSIVLSTRERVHDLGVFKAVGMTPRQTIAMVVCWVAGTGLVAGVLAVPAGIGLHHYVLPVMASAADLGLPASYLDVYGGGELVALGLAGIAIAAAGALLPAGWAARTATAAALRAE